MKVYVVTMFLLVDDLTLRVTQAAFSNKKSCHSLYGESTRYDSKE